MKALDKAKQHRALRALDLATLGRCWRRYIPKKGKSVTDQYCSICKGAVHHQPRYPNYVCGGCMKYGVEVEGKVIPINKIDVYSNLNVKCKVKGVDCNAQEARFGGIVVQVI